MARESSEPVTLARRSVLRTAAHAAWTVPAVSVAAAAPAFASSPGAGGLTAAELLTFPFQDQWFIVQVLSATNDGPDDLAPGTVFLTLAARDGALFLLGGPNHETQRDWALVSGERDDVLIYTFMGSVPVGSHGLGEREVELTGASAPTGVVDVTLSYAGRTVATATYSPVDHL